MSILNGTGCGLGLWGVGLVFLELHLWPCFILNNTSIHNCFQTWRPEHSIWRLEVTSQVVLVMNESGVSHTKVEQPGVLGHWTCYFADGFADQVCLSDAP